MASDQGAKRGAELRQRLSGTCADLDDLAEIAGQAGAGRETGADWETFLDVLGRDALAARAVVGLVLTRPAISSQLVDNLNASLHVRALLTDLFLLDEILKLGVTDEEAAERT